MTLTLNAEKRTKIGKLESLRKDGFIPAVFYGKKETSTPIQIKRSDFIKVWKEAGESTVISIKTGSDTVDALITEVDFDPIRHEPRHVDFYVFEKGHKMEVEIPLEFVGTSPAIKDLGGVLVKSMHEIKIKADPAKLPHQIEVDISSLIDFSSHILAKEINLPSGVELAIEGEDVVATVSAPREEKEEEVAAPVDLSQIEVEKKGKKEEEGEAASSE